MADKEETRYVLSGRGNAVLDTMMKKAVGGRGHKADNKHVRVTVTLPPHLLSLIDALAARRDISRSEALTIAAGMGLKFIREKKQS